MKNALTKQGKPRLAVHHALDQLHPGHMALDLPVVDGERSSGLHSRLILFHTMRKAFQFGQVTLVDEGSPGREPLPFPFAQHLEKVLRQAIRCLQGWMSLAKCRQIHSAG